MSREIFLAVKKKADFWSTNCNKQYYCMLYFTQATYFVKTSSRLLNHPSPIKNQVKKNIKPSEKLSHLCGQSQLHLCQFLTVKICNKQRNKKSFLKDTLLELQSKTLMNDVVTKFASHK